jgi:NADPH-dependent curcumin reductase CurA
MVTSREIRLKSRPVGMPGAENFELATVTVPDPPPGEVQVKNIWMTVDPYMRGRMVDRASYVPPFQLGEPLQGGAAGEVVASNNPRLKRGDLVSAHGRARLELQRGDFLFGSSRSAWARPIAPAAPIAG